MVTKETPQNSVNKSYSLPKWVRNTALAATLLASGCRIASYEGETKEGTDLHGAVQTEQLHKKTLKDFVDEKFKGLLDNAKIEEADKVKVTPPEADGDYKTRLAHAVQAGKVADAEKTAFEELFKVNQDLEKLQNGMGMQRYVIGVVYDNASADLEAFRITKLDDKKNVGDALTDLKTHLKDLTFEERKSLDAKFSNDIEFEIEKDGKKQMVKLDDEEYKKIKAYQVEGLKTIDGLVVMARAASTQEGKLGDVDACNQYSAAILNSLAGIDQYQQGKKVLDAILDNYTIGDITKGREASQIAKKFTPDTKLRDAYNKLLETVTKQAESGDYETTDAIANAHGYHILNMLAQAHMSGNFQYVVDAPDGKKEVKPGHHLFMAANKSALSDIVSAWNKGGKRESGVNLWVTLGAALDPTIIYTAYTLVGNAEQAFTSNWYDPKADEASQALFNTADDGSLQTFGFKNSKHFKGDNSAAKVYMIAGGIGLAKEGVGVYFGVRYLQNRKDKKDSSATPSGQPPIGGGGTTQPPIR